VGHASLWIQDKDDGALKLQASGGPVLIDTIEAESCLQSLDVEAIALRQQCCVIDIDDDRGSTGLSNLSQKGIATEVVCPLMVQNRLLGLLGAFTRRSAVDEVVGDLASISGILELGIERKRAEESLAMSEEFINRIMESSKDCIKILDLEGSLLYMNPGGARALEVEDPSQLIGTNWADFFSGADKQAARDAITKARSGGTGTMQGQCPSQSGVAKWWEGLATPIANGQGEVERLLVISRDITASKQAEEDLRIALEEVQRLKDQLHQENVYLQEEIK